MTLSPIASNHHFGSACVFLYQYTLTGTVSTRKESFSYLDLNDNTYFTLRSSLCVIINILVLAK